jgi:hypothetical protein
MGSVGRHLLVQALAGPRSCAIAPLYLIDPSSLLPQKASLAARPSYAAFAASTEGGASSTLDRMLASLSSGSAGETNGNSISERQQEATTEGNQSWLCFLARST